MNETMAEVIYQMVYEQRVLQTYSTELFDDDDINELVPYIAEAIDSVLLDELEKKNTKEQYAITRVIDI